MDYNPGVLKDKLEALRKAGPTVDGMKAGILEAVLQVWNLNDAIDDLKNKIAVIETSADLLATQIAQRQHGYEPGKKYQFIDKDTGRPAAGEYIRSIYFLQKTPEIQILLCDTFYADDGKAKNTPWRAV